MSCAASLVILPSTRSGRLTEDELVKNLKMSFFRSVSVIEVPVEVILTLIFGEDHFGGRNNLTAFISSVILKRESEHFFLVSGSS